jgi:hypothetical protein
MLGGTPRDAAVQCLALPAAVDIAVRNEALMVDRPPPRLRLRCAMG